MKLLILLAAAAGAVAFWRRKTLKSDVAHAKAVAQDAGSKASAKLRGGEDGSGDVVPPPTPLTSTPATGAPPEPPVAPTE